MWSRPRTPRKLGTREFPLNPGRRADAVVAGIHLHRLELLPHGIASGACGARPAGAGATAVRIVVVGERVEEVTDGANVAG